MTTTTSPAGEGSGPTQLSGVEAMTVVASPAGAWREPPCGAVTQVEWSCHLNAPKAVDPYLIWADMTAFLGMGGWDETQVLHEGQLPLLLEFDSAPLGPGDDIAFGLLRIAGIHFVEHRVEGVTQRIAKTRFKQLTALVQATQFGTLLLGSQHLVRYQLGLPRVPQIAVGLPDLGTPTADGLQRTILGFIDDGCAFAHPALADAQGLTRVEALWDQERPALPDSGDWKVVPSLGYGGELDRKALLRACDAQPNSGIAGPDPLAPYRRVDYLPTRLELGRTSLRRKGVARLVPAGAMRGSTHGSAVMDLAMGLPSPLRQRPSHIDPKGLEADRTLADLDRANDWRAVFVQLPTATVADTSGGSLGYHVLDGVHYIMQRAQQVPPISQKADQIPPFADNPIVINISYGALAGAHDGGSIIESAISDLVKERTNSRLWVVVAAGNAHRAQGYARLRLRPGVKPCARLVWNVPPDNPLESYLEIWLPTTDAEGRPVPSLADRLMLTVTPPGVDAAALSLRVGQARALYEDDRGVRRLREEARCTAGAIFARRVAQTAPESTATMLLLAVAPTRRPWPSDGPARAAGPAGDWSVELSLDPTSDVAVGGAVDLHAWAERSDQVFGLPRGPQSRVWADQPPPEPTESSPGAKAARGRGLHERGEQVHRAFEPRPTLGSLAGVGHAPRVFHDDHRGFGGHVIVVGAHRRSDGEMTADSSGGPSRPIAHDALVQAVIDGDAQSVSRLAGAHRLSPDVDAPGDESAAVAGLAVNGTRSGLIGRVGASSAAAATVTRLIANSLTWKADSLGRGAPGAATPESKAQADKARRRLLDAGLTKGEAPDMPMSRRGTPTPTLDDAFRRGRQRAR